MGHRLTRRSERERGRLRAAHFGIYPQTGNLFDHLTVEANLRFQMYRPARTTAATIDELMESLDLGRLRHRLPAQLSGGERARAGLAAALANDPALLLADEPTAEVDRASESIIFRLLSARRWQGRATLFTSHSPALMKQADRLLQLHDGRLLDA